MADQQPDQLRSRFVVARSTAGRAARSGLVWGLLLGLLVANEMISYPRNFPDQASRDAMSASFQGAGGLSAISGEPQALDTLEGFVAWRMLGLLIIVCAVWGILTSTRLLRGEEDAGRWELLLSGRTSRGDSAVQGLVGLAAGYAALWLAVAVPTVLAGLRAGVDIPVSAALFYAASGTVSGALFLGVGAVASQLTESRRRANGLAFGVFGLLLTVRMVADGHEGWGGLRWVTPLGWVENLRPLTGAEPVVLVPLAILVAGCAVLAPALARRRDVGAAVWAAGGRSPRPSKPLHGSLALALRLERGAVVGWVLSLGLLALVFGWVARAAASAGLADEVVTSTVRQMGGRGSGAAAWLGYEFVYLAGILCFAAAAQVSALRAEEADGHLDHLLARRVGRGRWLASRLTVACILVASAALAAGLGGWAGLLGTGEVGLGDMLRAGLNVAVPALFMVGLGTLFFGLAPRMCAPALYAVAFWSVLGSIFGTSLIDSAWVLDTAVLTLLSPVPAAGLDWVAIGILLGCGAVAAAAGTQAFARRDVVSA